LDEPSGDSRLGALEVIAQRVDLFWRRTRCLRWPLTSARSDSSIR